MAIFTFHLLRERKKSWLHGITKKTSDFKNIKIYLKKMSKIEWVMKRNLANPWRIPLTRLLASDNSLWTTASCHQWERKLWSHSPSLAHIPKALILCNFWCDSVLNYVCWIEIEGMERVFITLLTYLSQASISCGNGQASDSPQTQ